jgi:N-acetylglucosaminyldiphosphoundecaprenol N-acetyl-beta-D-mannosaminyltransferase
MKSVNIFGIDFAIIDYQGAVNNVLVNVRSKLPFRVFALPVHGVIEYQNNEEFRRAVDAADMIVPDGQPVRWAMNYFYDAGLKDRVYGPFLMRSLLEEVNQAGMSVFLYGGKTKKVLLNLSLFIQKEYPRVNVCGAYREDRIGVETLSIEDLNECEPDIVFVGLGCLIKKNGLLKTATP